MRQRYVPHGNRLFLEAQAKNFSKKEKRFFMQLTILGNFMLIFSDFFINLQINSIT